MSRISIPTREQALPETHQILDDAQRRLGFIPNVIRLLSLSPTALRGFVTLLARGHAGLSGNIDPNGLRER